MLERARPAAIKILAAFACDDSSSKLLLFFSEQQQITHGAAVKNMGGELE